MNARKREAQVSAGKLRIGHEQRLDAARDGLAAAEAQVRDDAAIRIDLPGTAVPAGRTVATVDDERDPRARADRPGRRERQRQDHAAAPDRRRRCRSATCRSGSTCSTTRLSVLDNVRAAAPAATRSRCGPGWPGSW